MDWWQETLGSAKATKMETHVLLRSCLAAAAARSDSYSATARRSSAASAAAASRSRWMTCACCSRTLERRRALFRRSCTRSTRCSTLLHLVTLTAQQQDTLRALTRIQRKQSAVHCHRLYITLGWASRRNTSTDPVMLCRSQSLLHQTSMRFDRPRGNLDHALTSYSSGIINIIRLCLFWIPTNT